MKSLSTILLSALLLPLVLTKEHPPPPDFHSTPEIESLTDRLLYGATIEGFLKEKASSSHSADLDWRDNGCTLAPNKPFGYNFLPSCQRHDFCYLNYRKQSRYEKLKSKCDDNFRQDMYNQCEKSNRRVEHCRSVARIYHMAVKSFGDHFDMYELPTDMLEDLQGSNMTGEMAETETIADGGEE